MKLGLSLLLVFINLSLLAQESLSKKKQKKILKEAYKFERKTDFELAKENFIQVLTKGETDSFKTNFDLGILFSEEITEIGPSLKYYKQAAQNFPKDTVNELFYFLGKAYQYMERYPEAIESFTTYQHNIKNNRYLVEEIQREIDYCKWSDTRNSLVDGWVDVSNLGDSINTKYAEYTPVYDAEDGVLLFTSRRPESVGGKKDHWDDKYFEDMYISHSTDAKTFSNSIPFSLSERFTQEIENTKKHDAIVSISPSGKKIFIYRGNKLYSADIIEQHLSNLQIMPKEINIGWYQSHATITANDSVLYFTSDKAMQTNGGIDIFKSTIDANGEWSEAENLGETINTTLDEESPLITPDGKTLYFASKGHSGFGGYDMFKSELLDNGTWSKPENLGMPINSGGDDLYLSLNENNKFQFISSTRKNGFGQMDIYYIDHKSKPDFTNCVAFQNKSYKVNFNAGPSIDEQGAPKNFQWKFHDETIVNGAVSDYTYTRPGKFPIELNVLDLTTNTIEYKEDEFEVDINNVNHVEFIQDDTISIDSLTNLDASISQLKDTKIEHYWWDFGDESLNYLDTVKTAYKYSKTGDFLVKMEVESTPVKGEIKGDRFCIYKGVNVLSTSDFELYKNNKQKRDSILLTQNVMASNDNSGLNSDGSFINSNPNKNTDDETSLKGVDWSKINKGNPYGMKLEPIYYNFDKHNIRKDADLAMQRNLDQLMLHKDVVIKISAHTDSRGSKKYNIKLSERRAKAAYKWLIKNGVEQDRIAVVLYFGEDKLVTDCPDGKPCSPTDHQLNRRSEFEIIGTLKN